MAARSADFFVSWGAAVASGAVLPCRPSLSPLQSSFAVVSSPPGAAGASPSPLVVARASTSAFVASAGPWACCRLPFPSWPAPAAVGARGAGCGSRCVDAARAAPAGRRESSPRPWTWPCSAQGSESQTRGPPQRPEDPVHHLSGQTARARRECCGHGGLWRVAPPEGCRCGHPTTRCRVSSCPGQILQGQQKLAYCPWLVVSRWRGKSKVKMKRRNRVANFLVEQTRFTILTKLTITMRTDHTT